MRSDPGYDDDAIPSEAEAGRKRRFKDFDCPECDANNPYDEAIGDGDEVRCYYCGQEFRASVSEEGRLKLRAM